MDDAEDDRLGVDVSMVIRFIARLQRRWLVWRLKRNVRKQQRALGSAMADFMERAVDKLTDTKF